MGKHGYAHLDTEEQIPACSSTRGLETNTLRNRSAELPHLTKLIVLQPPGIQVLMDKIQDQGGCCRLSREDAVTVISLCTPGMLRL